MKHLGQTKEKKTELIMDLGKVLMKSLKTLRMTMLRRLGCFWHVLSRGEGGRGGLAINTPFTRFCNKVFANRVFARFSKCKMHVFSQAFSKFANMVSQKYLGFASFPKYDFTGFHKLSHTFTNMVSHCFAIFCKLSKFIVLQTSSLAKFCKRTQNWFSSSQGFTMGNSLVYMI